MGGVLSVNLTTVRLFLHVLAAGTQEPGYRSTLVVKLVLVAASGIGALLHARSRTATGLAVWGAVTGVGAVGALFVGVLLAG